MFFRMGETVRKSGKNLFFDTKKFTFYRTLHSKRASQNKFAAVPSAA